MFDEMLTYTYRYNDRDIFIQSGNTIKTRGNINVNKWLNVKSL
jgi:hypothetical protein